MAADGVWIGRSYQRYPYRKIGVLKYLCVGAALTLLTMSSASASVDCVSHFSVKHQRCITRCASEVRAFRKLHPCPATGLVRGTCHGWVVDHIVALECGGADDPSNMQWQTVEDAKAKDKWEGKCQ